MYRDFEIKGDFELLWQHYGKVPPYIEKKLQALRAERQRLEERERKKQKEQEKQKVYLLKGGSSKKGKVLSKTEYQVIGETERKNLIEVKPNEEQTRPKYFALVTFQLELQSKFSMKQTKFNANINHLPSK